MFWRQIFGERRQIFWPHFDEHFSNMISANGIFGENVPDQAVDKAAEVNVTEPKKAIIRALIYFSNYQMRKSQSS